MHHGKSGISMSHLQINSSFWQGKRVLLTGHTGFKGCWLSLWLQSMEAKLCGIALPPPTNPSLFDVALVANGMEHRIVDIRDFNAVKFHINEFKPEIIFHMAAQPLVKLSYLEPINTFSTNVMGTVHVLEAARLCGTVKAIINITTDKCYENREWVWGYREDDRIGGHDPYSSSKACAELVSSAYRKSFFKEEGIAIATARAGNVIGGGDWALDRLIPDILRELQRNKPIEIRNPNAIRPWQHVLEPLSGYLMLAERLYTLGQVDAEGWNFGPKDNDARSVQWIVEYLCEIWGHQNKWTQQLGTHLHEASFLKLDISKARQRLQWEPRWSLETALTQVTAWHTSWLAGEEMRAVCLDQIYQYGANR